MPTWEDPLNINDKYHLLCTSESAHGSLAVKDISVYVQNDVIYDNVAYEPDGSERMGARDDGEELYQNVARNSVVSTVYISFHYEKKKNRNTCTFYLILALIKNYQREGLEMLVIKYNGTFDDSW